MKRLSVREFKHLPIVLRIVPAQDQHLAMWNKSLVPAMKARCAGDSPQDKPEDGRLY